jgi:hypothetical protein
MATNPSPIRPNGCHCPNSMTYIPNTEAVCEGADVPEPIRVFLYGDGFASIDGELSMSAFGSGALQTIARKLIAVGYDPDQVLDVHRGGDCITRLPLRDAARDGDAHD